MARWQNGNRTGSVNSLRVTSGSFVVPEGVSQEMQHWKREDVPDSWAWSARCTIWTGKGLLPCSTAIPNLFLHPVRLVWLPQGCNLWPSVKMSFQLYFWWRGHIYLQKVSSIHFVLQMFGKSKSLSLLPLFIPLTELDIYIMFCKTKSYFAIDIWHFLTSIVKWQISKGYIHSSRRNGKRSQGWKDSFSPSPVCLVSTRTVPSPDSW